MSSEEQLRSDLNIIKIENMSVGQYCFDEIQDIKSFVQLRTISAFEHNTECETIVYLSEDYEQMIQETITHPGDRARLIEIVKAAKHQGFKYLCVYA